MSTNSLLLRTILPQLQPFLGHFRKPLCSQRTPSLLFSILLKEESGKRLFDRIEKSCRPDVTARVKRLLSDLKDLQELQLEMQVNQPKGTSLSSELNHDLQMIQEEFLVDLEPGILHELTRDEDFFIKTVLLEVSAGVGGQEAMLFAAELLNLYEKYCASKGWSVSSLSFNGSDLGGIKSASIEISGQECFYYLRNEAGVHRVQRVPSTEKTGRVHTSTAAVTIIPVDEREGQGVTIDPKDIKVSTKRSSGPGGQLVNKKESCVVITHIPTNITVECQEERHQFKNREIALNKLQNLLTLRQRDSILEKYEKTKGNQVVTKDRSQKVRTYNFPQDRITDHRLSDNVHDIRSFMEGNTEKLDKIIAQLNQQACKTNIEKLIKEIG